MHSSTWFNPWSQAGLASRVISCKEADPFLDASGLEVELDRLAYGLLLLTNEKYRVVENSR